MSGDETLVGSLAIGLAAVALLVAIGPWPGPYRLPRVETVQQRYGKAAARGLWGVIALTLLTAGVAILGGVRPSYTQPSPGNLAVSD